MALLGRYKLPDRFSLGTVFLDHWRSLRKFKGGGRDYAASLTLYGLPLLVGVVSIVLGVWKRWIFPTPVALLPAVTLLAGVLLAAASQTITLRARIADSLVLSASTRVSAHIRETMSGLLLGAVAAMADAMLLGALAASTYEHYELRVWHFALSGSIVAITTYLGLMFIITARRLYTAYLEVFESGEPLESIRRTQAREAAALKRSDA